jgi:hypothetical protein
MLLSNKNNMHIHPSYKLTVNIANGNQKNFANPPDNSLRLVR